MVPLCIYHKGCADGFTAAWAVWRALGAIDFHPAAYGDAPPDVTGRDVIMVDFSYKRPVIDAMAATCRTMLILDHHKTAQEDLAGLSCPFVRGEGWDGHMTSVHNAFHVLDRDPRAPFAIFDMDRSGAQIAWDFFHPMMPRPALVDHVADRDLWQFRLPDTRAIAAALHSRPFSFEAFDHWEYLLEFSDTRRVVVAEGEAILRVHDQHVASLIRAAKRFMRIGGALVPVVNAPHFMASDVGNALAQEASFGATYFDNAEGKRVFSLRSVLNGADVSRVAAGYGGGGHVHAAGFQVPLGWEGEK